MYWIQLSYVDGPRGRKGLAEFIVARAADTDNPVMAETMAIERAMQAAHLPSYALTVQKCSLLSSGDYARGKVIL